MEFHRRKVNYTQEQRREREELETRILHLEAENKSLIYALQEVKRQTMDSILRRRTA